MDLILWRHGPAQDPDTGSADHTRELTPDGLALANKAANSLAYMIGKTGLPVTLWSSPLQRARQTADILAQNLSIPVSEHPAIAEGRLEVLAAAWQALTPHSTLILVGHEPHLSQWGARIAGLLLPFSPAAAAAFTISAGLPPQGRLLWFAQAQVLAQWGQ